MERICHDWDNSAERMRKALGYKEGVKLHACCGLFLHFLELLHQKAPAGEFPDFEKQLRATFMSGLMDAELTHIAETAVPPGDITAIGAFRLRSGSGAVFEKYLKGVHYRFQKEPHLIDMSTGCAGTRSRAMRQGLPLRPKREQKSWLKSSPMQPSSNCPIRLRRTSRSSVRSFPQKLMQTRRSPWT